MSKPRRVKFADTDSYGSQRKQAISRNPEETGKFVYWIILLIPVSIVAAIVATSFFANFQKSQPSIEPIDTSEYIFDATIGMKIPNPAHHNPRSTSTVNALVVAKNLEHGYLNHVIERLESFGNLVTYLPDVEAYNRHIEKMNDEMFDLLWSHDYPFSTIAHVEPRVRINHFPGSGFITNKLSLSVSKGIPNKPDSYFFPRDLDLFKSGPGAESKLWVVKTNSHRCISVANSNEVENIKMPKEGILIQEFVANPYLIDGKKFDIGIYAVLTSVEPIRVYIYDEVLIRFCKKNYHDISGNFNSTDIDTFVIGDDYTPIWEMKSLRVPYTAFRLGMKRALDWYLGMKSQNSSKLWSAIEETIMETYKSKESLISKFSTQFQRKHGVNSTSIEGSMNQFFELVRFDFIVDEFLNPYLMEANMSPNLSSAKHPPNRNLYEQVLNSFFSLVGLTRFTRENMVRMPLHHENGSISLLKDQPAYDPDAKYGLDRLIEDRELSVRDEICLSDRCHRGNCDDTLCKICLFCLDYASKLHIRRAIYEHRNKWNFKRILPSTRVSDKDFQISSPEDVNYVHTEFFKAKCELDKSWCSS